MNLLGVGAHFPQSYQGRVFLNYFPDHANRRNTGAAGILLK